MEPNMELSSENLEDLLWAVTRIAVDAGNAILQAAANGMQIDDKTDGSPVTNADRASHRVVVTGLAQVQPAFPVISEEDDAPRENSAHALPKRFWLVDPLDGTKEYVSGTGEYTVNIALIQDDQPILGVIVVPATGWIYRACIGSGSWRLSPDDVKERLPAEPGPETGLRAAVSRSHSSPATERFLSSLGATDVVPCGSSVKICAVAEGRADIYPRLGPTWYWDTGAGTIIAREAGCRVVDLHGNALHYGAADPLKHYGFVVHRPDLCEVELQKLLPVSV